MQTQLDHARLGSGEDLTIVRVDAPDEALGPEVRDLLGHKGDSWREHIRAALAGETDLLETRFYLGLIDGYPVANVMTVERHGFGLFGHVFTRPEHRLKGICRLVISAQMECFRSRGGRALLLGTGFESPPYRIYESFGFRSIKGGEMALCEGGIDAATQDWFAPGPAEVVEPRWEHWPLVSVLAAIDTGEPLRSVGWEIHDIQLLEAPYCSLMYQLGRNAPGVSARILAAANGAVVGCATALPSRDWPDVFQVDVFTHLNFTVYTKALLEALPLPSGKLIAATDRMDERKADIFRSCGFENEGTLQTQYRYRGEPRDILLFGKVNA